MGGTGPRGREQHGGRRAGGRRTGGRHGHRAGAVHRASVRGARGRGAQTRRGPGHRPCHGDIACLQLQGPLPCVRRVGRKRGGRKVPKTNASFQTEGTTKCPALQGPEKGVLVFSASSRQVTGDLRRSRRIHCVGEQARFQGLGERLLRQ